MKVRLMSWGARPLVFISLPSLRRIWWTAWSLFLRLCNPSPLLIGYRNARARLPLGGLFLPPGRLLCVASAAVRFARSAVTSGRCGAGS